MDVIDQLRVKSSRFIWSSQCVIQSIPRRGTSVICGEGIPANQVIIRIPPDLLINAQTIDLENNDKFGSQELLAYELLVQAQRGGDSWIASLPSNFPGMPVTWDSKARELSPNSIRIKEQLAEIEAFFDKCGSEFTRAQCEWAWLAVNTRCLFWKVGGMTLAPAVDYLNHTPDNLRSLLVESDSRGITVTTRRAYTKGEELTFCYGPHDNAFLLTEYGFVADENSWDCLDISKQILTSLAPSWQSWLKEQGYWGDYTIDLHGQPSFRTEIALAALQNPNERVIKNMVNGFDDGHRFETQSHQILKSIASRLKTHYQQDPPNVELKLLYQNYLKILEKVGY